MISGVSSDPLDRLTDEVMQSLRACDCMMLVDDIVRKMEDFQDNNETYVLEKRATGHSFLFFSFLIEKMSPLIQEACPVLRPKRVELPNI